MNVLQIWECIRNASFPLCFRREQGRRVNADRAQAKAVSSQIRPNRAEELLVQKRRTGTAHPVISTAHPPPFFTKARRQQSPSGKGSLSLVQMSLRTLSPVTQSIQWMFHLLCCFCYQYECQGRHLHSSEGNQLRQRWNLLAEQLWQEESLDALWKPVAEVHSLSSRLHHFYIVWRQSVNLKVCMLQTQNHHFWVFSPLRYYSLWIAIVCNVYFSNIFDWWKLITINFITLQYSLINKQLTPRNVWYALLTWIIKIDI